MEIEHETSVICNNCQIRNQPNLKYCYSCGYELPKSGISNVIDGNATSEYDFIYTSTKYSLVLLGVCFGVLILLVVVFLNVFDNIAISLVLSFSIPVIIFFIFKKNIKRLRKGEIKNRAVVLTLDNEVLKVNLSEIESYKVEHINGVAFQLKLKSGKKHKIYANDNFCDATSFEDFTDYFETTISNYRRENNLEIIRRKSVFEYKWMFYLLIAMSILAGGTSFYAIFFTDRTPWALYSSLGWLMVMWGAYYKTQKRKKEK